LPNVSNRGALEQGSSPPAPGDPVRVRGFRGQFRLAHWRTEKSGCLVATVFGGTANHSSYRSVTADRIIDARPKRQQRGGADVR